MVVRGSVRARGCSSGRALVGAFVLVALFIAAAGFVAAVGTGAVCITSAERPANRHEGSVQPFSQESDRDGDGIPDGEDILQGALGYVSTRPRYRSAYYQGGYPTDGCGVCTDLVAAACRAAGYDLRDLIHADRLARPDAYADGETPDPNIDYRRVRNLRVYLRHAATALTADASAIDQWQPGDIVLFSDHIGIVSDRRNERGVPYLIHHANPFQLHYEEDKLESYGDITDHVRLP